MVTSQSMLHYFSWCISSIVFVRYPFFAFNWNFINFFHLLCSSQFSLQIWILHIDYGSTPRAEVEDFFKRMDRDYDGRLSFGEFMGEETPLEKVLIVLGVECLGNYWENKN